MLKLFAPFFVYFILFLVYTTWTMKRKQDEYEDNPREETYVFVWVNLGFACSNLFFIALFFYVELR